MGPGNSSADGGSLLAVRSWLALGLRAQRNSDMSGFWLCARRGENPSVFRLGSLLPRDKKRAVFGTGGQNSTMSPTPERVQSPKPKSGGLEPGLSGLDGT